MNVAVDGHTYLFVPGRWSGKGVLSIIDGRSEPIVLQMIVSRSGTGIITAHMELGFNETHIDGGVEVVYTIEAGLNGAFSFVQYHSKLGELKGEGSVTHDSILLSYQSDDGSFGGFESLEKLDNEHYRLRGTLSLNGMPSSVLEASMHLMPQVYA